jgi:hypothetical protein
VEKKKYCLHQVRVRSFSGFGRVFERARGERMRENLLLLFFYLSLNRVSKIANRCPLSLSQSFRAKFLPLLLANAKNKDKTHREEEKSSIRSKSVVFFPLSLFLRARVRAFGENVPREGFGFFSAFFAFDNSIREEKFAEGREKASRTSCKKRFFVGKSERERRERSLFFFFIFLDEICAGGAACRRRGQNTKKGERER